MSQHSVAEWSRRESERETPASGDQTRASTSRPASRRASAVLGNQLVTALLGPDDGAGQVLPPRLRVRLERRMGADLRHVRVHTGTTAADSADRMSARAYTVGSHVVFGAGEYRAGDPVGEALLAHEMAHVVQQTRGGAAVGVARAAKDGAEAEPDDSLGPVADLALDVATRTAVGSGVQGEMLKAGSRGFIAELIRQVKPGEQLDRLKSSLRELLHPRNAADFAVGSSTGFTAGMVSPVTDLLGLAAMVEQLPLIARNLLLKAWDQGAALAEQAKALAVEAGVLVSGLPMRLAAFLKDKTSLDAVLADMRARAIAEAAGAGRGAARLIVGFFAGEKKPEHRDTSVRDLLTAHTEEEKSGLVSMVLGKAERARKMLLNTPWADFGYKLGHALGAVVSNLLIFVFSDGIGNAIAKVGQALGELAPILSRGAEGLVAIGKAIAFVESKIGAVFARGIKMAKPLEALANPVLGWLERFQGWLRKLFGVAEKGVAKAAVISGERAAETAAGKAAAQPAVAAKPSAAARPAPLKTAATTGATSEAGTHVAAPTPIAPTKAAPKVRVAHEAPKVRVPEEAPKVRVGEEAPKVRVGDEASVAEHAAEPVTAPPKRAQAAAPAPAPSPPLAAAEPVPAPAPKTKGYVIRRQKPTSPQVATPTKAQPSRPTPRPAEPRGRATEGVPEDSRMAEILEDFEEQGLKAGHDDRVWDPGGERPELHETPTPAQRLNLTSPSEELEAAMAAKGNPRPPGHSTHHIVADADEAAEPARRILKKCGIDPRNDWRNGIHLPQRVSNPKTIPEAVTQHSTLHTDSYYDTVNTRLQNAYEGKGIYADSPILDPKARVERELTELYEDLAKGDLPHPRKRD